MSGSVPAVGWATAPPTGIGGEGVVIRPPYPTGMTSKLYREKAGFQHSV